MNIFLSYFARSLLFYSIEYVFHYFLPRAVLLAHPVPEEVGFHSSKGRGNWYPPRPTLVPWVVPGVPIVPVAGNWPRVVESGVVGCPEGCPEGVQSSPEAEVKGLGQEEAVDAGGHQDQGQE